MSERMYQKLIVWKEAHSLCLTIYKITKDFPADEKFSLVSQMRRSAYGVPMNIAEGNARRTHKEKLRFVDIAIASLEELHYQCILSKDLGYIEEGTLKKLDDQIMRTGYLLEQLRKSLLRSESQNSSASSSSSPSSASSTSS